MNLSTEQHRFNCIVSEWGLDPDTAFYYLENSETTMYETFYVLEQRVTELKLSIVNVLKIDRR